MNELKNLEEKFNVNEDCITFIKQQENSLVYVKLLEKYMINILNNLKEIKNDYTITIRKNEENKKNILIQIDNIYKNNKCRRMKIKEINKICKKVEKEFKQKQRQKPLIDIEKIIKKIDFNIIEYEKFKI